MSLYREWSIDAHCLAAIWKIDEPESFFAERTGVEATIKSEKRRVEHLAGRFLLKHLKDDFPLLNIQPDEHDKPRIDNNGYYFSISHSWPYVAAVVNPYEEAGIDIQTWHPRIESIQHKFLSEEEQGFFNNDPHLITLAWCAKEAIYKQIGRRGVDFKEHLPITFFEEKNDVFYISIYHKLFPTPRLVTMEGIVHQHFACVYVIKEQDWAIW